MRDGISILDYDCRLTEHREGIERRLGQYGGVDCCWLKIVNTLFVYRLFVDYCCLDRGDLREPTLDVKIYVYFALGRPYRRNMWMLAIRLPVWCRYAVECLKIEIIEYWIFWNFYIASVVAYLGRNAGSTLPLPPAPTWPDFAPSLPPIA
jgi:hypothetical protein